MKIFKRRPEPPYYSVVFTSILGSDTQGYDAMSEKMEELAKLQPGFLELNSVRDPNGLGITVSYWKDEASILAWKNNLDHLEAQKLGRDKWYQQYTIDIARIERSYHINRSQK